eukprot:COSAG05_NODE_1263_length_5338_cov_44.046956_4_plen_427_part_00
MGSGGRRRLPLAAVRSANDEELAQCRAYLGTIDDCTIWHLLRYHSVVSTSAASAASAAAAASATPQGMGQQQRQQGLISTLVRAPLYMHPNTATRTTQAIRVPGFFSAADIRAVHQAVAAATAAGAEGGAAAEEPGAESAGSGAALGLCARADPCWSTSYLHTQHFFRRHCPALLQRIVALGERVAQQHWPLLLPPFLGGSACTTDDNGNGSDSSSLRSLRSSTTCGGCGCPVGAPTLGHGQLLTPRCIEYHTNLPGFGGLAPPPVEPDDGGGGGGGGDDDGEDDYSRGSKHYDQGSVITVDIMLSDTTDHVGGKLYTLEPAAESAAAARSSTPAAANQWIARQHEEFTQGDAMVFVSHKYHGVTPLTAGSARQVLVTELWQGEERACPHRCVQHWGACDFTAGCGDGDGAGTITSAAVLAEAAAK